jgi:PAS domain S-box-containing protein
MTIQDQQNEFRFLKAFSYVVAIICALPYGLNLAGFDFSSEVHGFHVKEIATWGISRAALVDEMFYTLTGALEHGLLEWSAVSVAALTILLAFSQFAINKDVTTPIIGIALFCSGTMDAFHTLAAMRLIDAVADNSNLIPFTWALSRGFNAAILIVGALICLRLGISDTRTGITKITLVSLFFGAVAYYLIAYSATNENLPITQFPYSFITRPYDVVPLTMFIVAIPIFWKLYKKRPSLLTASLVIAIIPEVVVESHMAFGSSTLFDNHFNIAHFLKIIAYLIPFIGLVLDYIGTYRKMNVVIEDLKATSLAKEKLSASLVENQLRTTTILSNAVDGIITIDEMGIVDSFNPAAVRLFGYEPSEVIGRNVKMLMPEPYSSEHDQYLKNFRDTGISKIIGVGREVVGLRKNGSTFPLELGISEMYAGEVRLFTGIVRDVTERKNYEEERTFLIKDLQESNDEMEEFTYRTSHDLKAPLVNIRGLSDIMNEDLEDGDYEEVSENLKKVGTLSLKLEKLVGEIVEVAKVDREQEKFEAIDIANQLEQIKASLSTLIDEKEVAVQLDLDGVKTVWAQKNLMQRVLENLISNAIKYSDPKKPQRFVKVGVSILNGDTQIEVSDNGLGIPDEYFGEVFGMFKRFHKSSSFGSGLGLYLIKKSIDKINGKISLESSPEGTVFTIILPALKPALVEVKS